MKRIRNERGLTLIEIIVAIAILAVILVAFLGMSTFGLTNLFFSGQKSGELMEVQSIVDDLNARDFMTTAAHPAQYYIDSYLTGKGYQSVSDPSQLSVQVSGKDVNFYVSAQVTPGGTKGNSVTIVKFTQNGKRNAELSTFLPDRGY